MLRLDQIEQMRWRLGSLVVAHLVIGTLLAVASQLDSARWIDVGYALIVLSELTLAALWIGLAKLSYSVRLVSFAIGFGWIEFLLLMTVPHVPHDTAIVFIPLGFMIGSVVPLFVYQHFVARISWFDAQQLSTMPHRMQFTVRSLFIATALLAASLAIGQFARARLYTSAELFGIIPIVSLSVAAVTWLMAWACLGLGNPWLRIPFALMGSATVGLFVAYCDRGSREAYAFTAIVATLIAIVSSISILLVRRWGFRLLPIADRPVQGSVTEQSE